METDLGWTFGAANRQLEPSADAENTGLSRNAGRNAGLEFGELPAGKRAAKYRSAGTDLSERASGSITGIRTRSI
jgi:hypothetical protein